jgi:hypothetical protein
MLPGPSGRCPGPRYPPPYYSDPGEMHRPGALTPGIPASPVRFYPAYDRGSRSTPDRTRLYDPGRPAGPPGSNEPRRLRGQGPHARGCWVIDLLGGDVAFPQTRLPSALATSGNRCLRHPAALCGTGLQSAAQPGIRRLAPQLAAVVRERPPKHLAFYGGLSARPPRGGGTRTGVRNIGGLRMWVALRCNSLPNGHLRHAGRAPGRRAPANHIGGLGGLGLLSRRPPRKWLHLPKAARHSPG